MLTLPTTKTGYLKALVLLAVISVTGCARSEPYDSIDNIKLGIGTHNLRMPSLGRELTDELAAREKTWVSRIHIHGAPLKNQKLWKTTHREPYLTGPFTMEYINHSASYYLAEDMTAELRRVLNMYYHISPHSDVEVDARLSVEQSGRYQGVHYWANFYNVSSKFSLRLTESVGSQRTSDKIFTGHYNDLLYLDLSLAIFPRKHEAEEMLEQAYRKMWRDLLDAKVN